MQFTLPEHLRNKPVSDFIENKPLLWEKYCYETVDGTLYYYWSDHKNGKFSQNHSLDFDMPPPIIYESSKDLLGNYDIFEIPGLFSNQFGQTVKYTNAKETGYVKPSFPFLAAEYNEFENQKIAYERALTSFGLDGKSLIPPEKVVSLHTYKSALLSQIKRQADKVVHFNQKIASILKVYCYELGKADLDDKGKAYQNTIVQSFFLGPILKGANSGNTSTDWLQLKSVNDTFDHIAKTTQEGINALLQKRDDYLNIALKLAQFNDAVEFIFERAILSDRLLTPKEYLYKTMPDPFKVASEMESKAKNATYSPETIGKAMAVVQKYIIENEISTLWRKLNSVVNLIIEMEIPGIVHTTDSKTVRNWVEVYAKAAGISYSNPNLV